VSLIATTQPKKIQTRIHLPCVMIGQTTGSATRKPWALDLLLEAWRGVARIGLASAGEANSNSIFLQRAL